MVGAGETTTLVVGAVGVTGTLLGQWLANSSARRRSAYEMQENRRERWLTLKMDAYRLYLHTSRESLGTLGVFLDADSVPDIKDAERRVQQLLAERRAARADLDLFASEAAGTAADRVDEAVDSLGEPTANEITTYVREVLGVRRDREWTEEKRLRAREHFYARTHRERILPAIENMARICQTEVQTYFEGSTL